MISWQTKKLGDVSEIMKGKSLSKDDIIEGGKYECIHYGELFTKYKEVIKAIRSRTDLSEDVFFSKSNDVLMPTSDVTPRGLATASYLPFDNVVIGGDVLVIRPHENELDGRFLAYYVAGDKNAVLRLTSGSTIFHLYGSDMKKMKLNMPEKPEQERIVEVLEVWDKYIEKLEQKIALKEQLKKGLMQQLLTGKRRLPGFKGEWHDVKLGDVLEKIEGGGTPSKEKREYWNGGIPWASVKDIVTHNSQGTQDYISSEGLSSSSSKLIKAGTLITPTRMALGHAVFFEVDVAINQDLKALYPASQLNKYFLFYWFQLHKDAIRRLGSGSTVAGIQLAELKSLIMTLPTIMEQMKIINVLQAVDNELKFLKSKSSQLKYQKNYLLKNLITGMIRMPETTSVAKGVINQ